MFPATSRGDEAARQPGPRRCCRERSPRSASGCHWQEWTASIRNLNYRTRLIAMNSMHARSGNCSGAAPQSRDRLYLAYWAVSIGRDHGLGQVGFPAAGLVPGVRRPRSTAQPAVVEEAPAVTWAATASSTSTVRPNAACRNAIVEPTLFFRPRPRSTGATSGRGSATVRKPMKDATRAADRGGSAPGTRGQCSCRPEARNVTSAPQDTSWSMSRLPRRRPSRPRLFCSARRCSSRRAAYMARSRRLPGDRAVLASPHNAGERRGLALPTDGCRPQRRNQDTKLASDLLLTTVSTSWSPPRKLVMPPYIVSEL